MCAFLPWSLQGDKAMLSKWLSEGDPHLDREIMKEEVIVVTDSAETEKPAVRGRLVHSKWARNTLTFLVVFGPGLIVMEADNDAGAVSTYVQAGAQYGTRLLWLLLLLLPVTYFIQEIVVRLGIATGKGHATMIYQRFGKWWGLFSLIDLQLVNFLTLVTEFAAIALALGHMNITPKVGVPVAAVGLMFMVLTGSYRRWEHITVFLCLLDISWLFIAFKLRPATLSGVFHDSFVAGLPPGGVTTGLVFLMVAIVGTTIAPWQLFFPAELCGRQAVAFCRSQLVSVGYLLGSRFHHHCCRLHDDRRQCRQDARACIF
jgi:NRAMP (natural resistance-associated macrophage protein)-like metal ion transporter